MDEKELEQLQLQVDKLTNEYEKLNTLTDETYKNKILNYTSELESIYNDPLRGKRPHSGRGVL